MFAAFIEIQKLFPLSTMILNINNIISVDILQSKMNNDGAGIEIKLSNGDVIHSPETYEHFKERMVGHLDELKRKAMSKNNVFN